MGTDETRAARGLSYEQELEATIIRERVKDIIGRRAVDVQIATDLASGRMTIERVYLQRKEGTSGTIYESDTGEVIVLRCRLTKGLAAKGENGNE